MHISGGSRRYIREKDYYGYVAVIKVLFLYSEEGVELVLHKPVSKDTDKFCRLLAVVMGKGFDYNSLQP